MHCRYVNVILGKQPDHAVEPYGKAQEIMRVYSTSCLLKNIIQ